MESYDFSGLWYHVWTIGVIIFVGGIASLLLSRFWVPGKLIKKQLITAIILILFSVGYSMYFVHKTYEPKIEICEGTLVREKRYHRNAPLSWGYTFQDESGKKTWCCIDSISRRTSVWPEGFEMGESYRVYYEADTDIIVKVEKIE